MQATSTGRLFDAVQHDNGSAQVLGVVAMAADGTLTIESAGDESPTLRTVVDELNQETQLHAPATPPEGARRFGVFTQPVDRGSDGFVPALVAFLRKYHDIELRPR